MTKEEYQKELVRMFDSLRDDKFKGETHCKGIKCIYCPLYHKACQVVDGEVYGFFNALEIIEKWSREHPITNAEKFKEVFGFEPNVFADNEKHILCNGYRTIDEKFWDAEYKGQPKE